MVATAMATEHNQQQILESRVLLIAPAISYFRGRYQIPKDNRVKITISDTEVDRDSLTTNSAVLFQKDWPRDREGTSWKKRFQGIDSRARALIERFSVPFPIRGVRIIPKVRGTEFLDAMFGLTVGGLRRKISAARANHDTQLETTLDRLLDTVIEQHPAASNSVPVYDNRLAADEQSIAYDLHKAASEFCETLDDVYAQIQRNIDPKVWESIQGKLLRDRGKMRAKFALDITPVELAGGNNNTLTAEDLTEHAAIIRETCQRRVAEAVEEMIRGPRNDLAEALANLQQLISDDGRVTAKSFSPVRAAIEKIRLFDFCADAQLLQQIRGIETRLNSTAPGDLNSITAVQNGFSATITAVMTEVQSEAAIQRGLDTFGSAAARGLDLD